MTVQIKSNLRSVYQSFGCAFSSIFTEMPNLSQDQALEMLTRLVKGKQIPQNSLMAIASGLYWHHEPQVLRDFFTTPEPLVVALAVAFACHNKLSPRTLVSNLCQYLPENQESFARTLQLSHALMEQGQSSIIAYRRLQPSPLAFGFYCFLSVPYNTEWTMILLKKYISQNSHLMAIRSIAAVFNQDRGTHPLGDWLYQHWTGCRSAKLPVVTSPDFLGRRV